MMVIATPLVSSFLPSCLTSRENDLSGLSGWPCAFLSYTKDCQILVSYRAGPMTVSANFKESVRVILSLAEMTRSFYP